ncbi:thrombospondin-1-like [Ostrea edulis]|uniref:thrombospondin-1-like n=1 Tax=Ostrea edulis TaxID=37623 RepID=UPI0020960909|nr:thrombospondin-1-like [Ostrea edulis]
MGGISLQTRGILVYFLLVHVPLSDGRRPVMGQWGVWSPWSGCTASCGSGISTRTANWIMNGIKTQYLFHDIMECSSPAKCPEDGHWGMWTVWSKCPVICGGGVAKRHRKCDNPEPSYGGRDCTGEDSQKQICNNRTCPVIPKSFDPSICMTDVFICKSAKYCVQKMYQCDGRLDCDDGSDESNCVIDVQINPTENSGFQILTSNSIMIAMAVILHINCQ